NTLNGGSHAPGMRAPDPATRCVCEHCGEMSQCPHRACFGWMHPGCGRPTSDGAGVPNPLADHEKSRPNPGPISLTSSGHVCTMFGAAKPDIEDLEGKSSSKALRALAVPRCKHMPIANLSEPPHIT